jgi:hypothetical protein
LTLSFTRGRRENPDALLMHRIDLGSIRRTTVFGAGF